MRKISLYLARHYFLNILFFLAVILSIIFVFDVLEILRRLNDGQVPILTILTMGALKLPEVGQVVFPFVILFSAMFTFWQLNRRQELIIMRSTGLSVWQFLAPVLIVAALTGFAQTSLINPLGSVLLEKYERYEQTYLKRGGDHLISSLDDGLWLRQVNQNKNSGGALIQEEIIIHSEKIIPKNWQFETVSIFKFDSANRFIERIDSPRAHLRPGEWQFDQAVIHHRRHPVTEKARHSLPTSLTPSDIENSFSEPENSSFWALPGLISQLHDAGFDTTRLRIEFHSLLALPLFFTAMVSIAAVISLKSTARSGGTLRMVMIGILTGFIIFFLANFLKAMGASNQMPVIVAAWSPALITFITGLAILLNTEDG